MSEDTTQVEPVEAEETEKAHDYDQKYAFDANSGLAPQPGGAARPAEPETELLVDSEGAVKAVQGEGDVTSKAHQAKIDTEGKSAEETEKAVAATENATDDATKDSGDVSGIASGAASGDTSGQAPADSTGEATGAATEATEAKPAFDPTGKSVADVKAYVAEHPDEKDAVLAAEAAGANRPTIAAL